METVMQVKNRKSPPEQIVDHTPTPFYQSPLQKFMENNCHICTMFKGICRLDDQNGMKRMELCIRLYTAAPPDVNKILQEALSGLNITQKTAELSLEDAETLAYKQPAEAPEK